MLKSLLIGVHGSQWSQAACEIGINWAASLQIPITCLGVVDLATLTPVEPVPLGATQYKAERDADAIAHGRQQVEAALQNAVRKAAAAGVECRVLTRDGNPSALLGEEAQRHDLVIIGRRVLPETDRERRPSETFAEILRHSPRPVVAAGQSVPNSSHVVIAYDGSIQAARTLQSFVSSGLCAGRALHLVGISDTPDAIRPALSRAADFLYAQSLQAEIHVLPVARGVADTLSGFARDIPAGILVMGVYGQPWYKELFFGSVTREVLAQVPVPLFLNH